MMDILSGKGSRKHKDYIIDEINEFSKKEALVDDILDGIDSKTSQKNEEIFALSDVVSDWGTSTKYDKLELDSIYKWQKSFIEYNEKLRNLSLYWYSQKGVLSEVYDSYRTLPTLDSAIISSNSEYPKYEEDLEKIKRFDTSITKTQIREMLLEVAIMGTLITYRRGTIVNPFIQILDLDYYYASRMKNGRWEVECDFMKFVDGTAQNNSMRGKPNDFARVNFDVLTPKSELKSQPLEVQENFKLWFDGRGKSTSNIYALSMAKTGVVKNKSRQRERYGRPVGIAAFEDLLHKDLLKLAERAVVDKVINTLITVKLGEEGKEGYHPSETQAKKVYDSVKKVLNDSTAKEGNKLVGLPYWASIEALKVDLGIFDNDKYAQIDQDILVSLGVSGVINVGQGNNYSSGKINENMFYSKIFDILEQIQEEIFDTQFANIINNANVVFHKQYARTVTVDNDARIEIFKDLLNKGGAIKPLLNEVGVDFEQYIKQVEYEKDDLATHSLFEPYLTSFTSSGDSDNGAPVGDDPDENKDSNDRPKPSTK